MALLPDRARLVDSKGDRPRERDDFDGDASDRESFIDESLEESFPASDPPSWTTLVRVGTPRRNPENGRRARTGRLAGVPDEGH
jgi:hypothetical protein